MSLAKVKSSPALMQIVPSRRPAKGDKVQLSLKFDPDAGGCLVGQQVGTVVQDDASSVPFQVRPRGAALPFRSAAPCSVPFQRIPIRIQDSGVSRNHSTGLVYHRFN
jgi:hypothetical protein